MAPKKNPETPVDGTPVVEPPPAKKSKRKAKESVTPEPAATPTEPPVETPVTPAPSKGKGGRKRANPADESGTDSKAKAAKAKATPVEAPAGGGAAAGLPPPAPTWENYEKLKQHFQLTDDEVHAVLASVCGPKPADFEESTPEISEKSVAGEDSLDGFPWNDGDDDEEDSPSIAPEAPTNPTGNKNSEKTLGALGAQPGTADGTLASTVKSVASPQVWYSKMCVVSIWV